MKGDYDMARLFGTDGIRGIAGKELTRSLAAGIGEKLTLILSRSGEKPKILLARDTRPSGQMLCLAIASGICSAGGDVLFADILPTPAVAFLTVHLGASAGIMVTASHNPSEYNGIKIFGGDGHKLCDELEDKIEAMLSRPSQNMPLCDTGEITILDGAGEYISHLVSATPSDLSGLHIAVDCACGSACVTAEKIFSSLGARCDMLFDKPDGTNINSGCGSTDVSYLSEYVRKNGLCGGAAFDGDADRCICVDETGNPIDGDSMLAALALDMKQSGKLHGGIVGTVMSNCGLIRFCDENGIRFLQTKVGDRYVLENMLENDFIIGGEQSGHIIFREHATTGDGELSALKLLCIMKETGKKLSELADVMQVFPQVLVNVRVSDFGKARFPRDNEIKNAVREAEKELGDDGRVLVRVSGTEPLVRVMIEGKDEEKINILAQEIAQVVKERLL